MRMFAACFRKGLLNMSSTAHTVLTQAIQANVCSWQNYGFPGWEQKTSLRPFLTSFIALVNDMDHLKLQERYAACVLYITDYTEEDYIEYGTVLYDQYHDTYIAAIVTLDALLSGENTDELLSVFSDAVNSSRLTFIKLTCHSTFENALTSLAILAANTVFIYAGLGTDSPGLRDISSIEDAIALANDFVPTEFTSGRGINP